MDEGRKRPVWGTMDCTWHLLKIVDRNGELVALRTAESRGGHLEGTAGGEPMPRVETGVGEQPNLKVLLRSKQSAVQYGHVTTCNKPGTCTTDAQD